MNQKMNRYGWLATAVLALALCSQSRRAAAAQDIQVGPSGIQTNGDSYATSIGNWGTYWITTSTNATFTATFDATMQSAPTIPGSVFCVCDWNGNGDTDINLGATLPNGGGTWLGDPSINVIDGTQYDYLVMDIYWTNVSGVTSWPEIGLMTPNYGTVQLTNNISIPATPGWQHYVIKIDSTLPNLSSIAGVYLYRWGGGPVHAEFWIDNVQLIAKVLPTPPPTVSLAPAPPAGLNLITTPVGNTPQYDRQMVYSKADVSGNYYSWVNALNPVTYSVTISSFPDDPPYGGFQAQLFLIPNSSMPWGQGDTSVDWNCTNLVWLDIKRNGADFRYKVNEGSGNTMPFNDQVGGQYGTNGLPQGHLGYLPSASVVGTWTLTCNNNTNFTVTNPEGVSTNFTVPLADAMLFADPLTVYVGAQANNAANVGQEAVVSHVKITGAAGALEDTFSGTTLNTTIWGVAAVDPSAVLVVQPDAKYWLSWTLPDSHFFPVASASVLGPWTETSLTNTFQRGTNKFVVVSPSDLPSPNSGYFRLMKRVATKLQVLLPGESNAPGTATGKTGTAEPQAFGTPFDVTVNACDATWHIVTAAAGDMIHLTSTDVAPPAANGAYLPPDAPLVSGTVTFSAVAGYGVILQDSGTWTITASDVTTNTVTDGVSTPITIP